MYVPPPQLERYTLHEKIGEGSFGEVYRATHTLLEREVAIKIIHGDLDDDAQKQFLREARAIAKLDHPHILQVFDFEAIDGNQHYMATAYLPDGDLRTIDRQRRANGDPFSLTEVLLIMKSVALGLHHAHQKGIIHRDIKPSNIFVSQDQHVVIGDFGLAKNLSGNDSISGDAKKIIGTPAYMSPEQLRGEVLDPRTDIYPLGVILYQLLTGEHPFPGEFHALLLHHLQTPIPDVTEKRPDLPRAVAQVIKKAMAKDRADRYQSALEFIADIDAITTGESNRSWSIDIEMPDPPPSIGFSSTQVVLEAMRQPRLRGWMLGFGAAIIVLVLAAVLLIGANNRRNNTDDNPPTANAFVMPDIAPADDGEILIIVAAVVDEETDINVGDLITEEMNLGALRDVLGDQLRIEHVEVNINQEQDAQAVGTDTNAVVVVWGQRNGAGYEIRVQGINRPEGTIQDLRLFVPAGDDFAAQLTEGIPALADNFARVLVVHHLASNNRFEDSLFLGATATQFDYEAFKDLAQRPLDENILNVVIYTLAGDYLKADEEATQLVDAFPNDYASWLLRWAANMYNNRRSRAISDAEAMMALDGEDGIFGHSILTLTYYLLNEPNPIAELTAPYMASDDPAVFFMQDVTIQLLIYEGEYAAVLEYTLENPDPFLGRILLLYMIQGNDAAFEAELPTYLDARTERYYIRFGDMFEQVNPTNFHPMALARLAFSQFIEGDPDAAITTLRAALLVHPDDYLLSWLLGEIYINGGSYRPAASPLQDAVENAPAPFPIAYYRRAQTEFAVPVRLPRNTADGCELLAGAEALANTDRDFYAVLLAQIETLNTVECSAAGASPPDDAPPR